MHHVWCVNNTLLKHNPSPRLKPFPSVQAAASEAAELGRASPRGAQEALLAAAGGAELYAALLCRFEPAGVLPFLQVCARGAPGTMCLYLCGGDGSFSDRWAFWSLNGFG